MCSFISYSALLCGQNLCWICHFQMNDCLAASYHDCVFVRWAMLRFKVLRKNENVTYLTNAFILVSFVLVSPLKAIVEIRSGMPANSDILYALLWPGGKDMSYQPLSL
ncbi:hypothetical protein O6H91_Y396900 [Diphasiastrum complanatum]|nr:hypothetical protein O6H91_Y396900 [Diphasiastrum complanatum]